MTTSKDLLVAILAMDSYNREYGEGISGLGGAGSKIGSATLNALPDGTDLIAWKSIGFYADSYKLDDGTTVISYRGTDTSIDYYYGWLVGAGLYGKDPVTGQLQASYRQRYASGSHASVLQRGHICA